MIFNAIFMVLAIAATTAEALPSSLAFTHDTEDIATCDYVFIPNNPVDPTTVNCVADFNYITGRSLAVASPSHTVSNGSGSTFVEHPDDVFHVHNSLASPGWTCAQTGTFMESLAGQAQLAPSGVTWLIKSVACSCKY